MQIKKIIKKVIGNRKLDRLSRAKGISKINHIGLIKTLLKTKDYNSYSKLANKIKYKSNSSKYFYHYIDIYKTYYSPGRHLGNMMIDYRYILDKSLKEYKEDINHINDKNFYKKEFDVLNSLEIMIDKEVNYISDEKVKDSLKGILNRSANSFRDALQRILFLNQVLWQTGIMLNGIGRLDYMLDTYYQKDLKNGVITREKAKEYLKDFLELLHNDYYFKSYKSLYGDTGQIIILGGLDSNGKPFYNDITYMLIELMKELGRPDPKVLLRVNKDTPRELMDISLKSIVTGIGCPLFANDDVIVEKLINFGYSKKDAYNYGTAACWEPYIIGKSFDQNNIDTINFMKPMKNIVNNTNYNNIEDFKTTYYKYLIEYLEEFRNKIDSISFSEEPLLSLFTENCIKNEKDISKGGAIYNNLGFTGVGLPNAVNSILTVQKLVFEDKKITLADFIDIINRNYDGAELLIKEIKALDDKYGVDKSDIILLTNEIMNVASKYFKDKTNKLGGKYKFGISAPTYITDSTNARASFDGRKNGEPFSVHISNDKANGYTELVNFASKLDYNDNKFNGNVIDFYVTPNFINDNYDKFLDFLIASIKNGFFEMQMNVVSSKTLIEARKNPKKFPNLVVRVWGFSAYFKDLPDEYKDYIIERALKNEGNY